MKYVSQTQRLFVATAATSMAAFISFTTLAADSAPVTHASVVFNK